MGEDNSKRLTFVFEFFFASSAKAAIPLLADTSGTRFSLLLPYRDKGRLVCVAGTVAKGTENKNTEKCKLNVAETRRARRFNEARGTSERSLFRDPSRERTIPVPPVDRSPENTVEWEGLEKLSNYMHLCTAYSPLGWLAGCRSNDRKAVYARLLRTRKEKAEQPGLNRNNPKGLSGPGLILMLMGENRRVCVCQN